jgi:hypothetical protein
MQCGSPFGGDTRDPSDRAHARLLQHDSEADALASCTALEVVPV